MDTHTPAILNEVIMSNGAQIVNALPIVYSDIEEDGYTGAWNRCVSLASGNKLIGVNQPFGYMWANLIAESAAAASFSPNFDTMAKWIVARGTLVALIVRDIATEEDYDMLTKIWRTLVGPVHPEDKDLR